eukprot:GHVR01085157.1.p1 GENE.GHVR01085157.1~~GHVR01085157.1.p1  ORF type:complete len:477 (+),score=78.56 GHVR01085157.1:218-1648(+)
MGCSVCSTQKKDSTGVKVAKALFCCWCDIWDGKACILWQILFCPFVMIFHALRIFCCGCMCVCWDRCAGCVNKTVCSCCYLYTDKKFPPDDKSLGEKRPDIVWKRATKIHEGKDKGTKRVLFSKPPTPSDVTQGGLGNCWLISGISSVRLIPGAIQRLFVTKERNGKGKYIIRLYDPSKKKWVRLAIDDHIPCKADAQGFQPAFAQVKGNELWVLLLEKAFARLYGSYTAIEGGMPSQAVQRMLGGDFTLTFKPENNGEKWKRGEKETLDNKEMFDVIAYYLRKKTAVSCWTMSGGMEETNDRGIVSGHAYAILNARQFGKLRLVRCRNPWGRGEWNGDWSDKSPLWRQNKGVGVALKASEQKEDGAFWMNWEDFCRVWEGVEVVDVAHNLWTIGYSTAGKEGTVFGPLVGCLSGCCKFWCLCQGVIRMFCYKSATTETVKVEKCCCGCCTLGPGCYWHSSKMGCVCVYVCVYFYI